MDIDTTTSAASSAPADAVTAASNEQGQNVTMLSSIGNVDEDAKVFNEEDLRELRIHQLYEPPKQYVNRQLFGGAITMDVPKMWLVRDALTKILVLLLRS